MQIDLGNVHMQGVGAKKDYCESNNNEPTGTFVIIFGVRVLALVASRTDKTAKNGENSLQKIEKFQ